MQSKNRLLTAIQVDVYYSDIPQPKDSLGKVKVYYDLVPLSMDEIDMLVK